MSSNWYDAMPADYGDSEETPVAEKVSPEIEKMLAEAAASPSVKRGRPSKKVEDEQGTTAKD